MAKTRLTIPKHTREMVMREYNHRCAICAKDNPQVHHIDEDPSNNDVLNLIPLCPNCHLIDQHNPTRSFEIDRLKLFREFKDPTIFKPQFDPLFNRMKFLAKIEMDAEPGELERCSKELTEFVSALEMGDFYSKRISEIVRRRGWGVHLDYRDMARMKAENDRDTREYIEQLLQGRKQVYSLIMELLRFQKW